MKKLLLLLSLAGSLAMAGCASTPTVSIDRDPAVNFSQYHTYSWITQPDGASPLVQQRIVDYVDAALNSKGWQRVDKGAQVAIAAHAATQQRQSVDTFYTGPAYAGWGWGGGWGWGAGMSTSQVHTYDVGTLVVDMFDTRTKRGIWRGSASGTLPSSVDKLNASLQAGVQKMFADFPPGTASQP